LGGRENSSGGKRGANFPVSLPERKLFSGMKEEGQGLLPLREKRIFLSLEREKRKDHASGASPIPLPEGKKKGKEERCCFCERGNQSF